MQTGPLRVGHSDDWSWRIVWRSSCQSDLSFITLDSQSAVEFIIPGRYCAWMWIFLSRHHIYKSLANATSSFETVPPWLLTAVILPSGGLRNTSCSSQMSAELGLPLTVLGSLYANSFPPLTMGHPYWRPGDRHPIRGPRHPIQSPRHPILNSKGVSCVEFCWEVRSANDTIQFFITVALVLVDKLH